MEIVGSCYGEEMKSWCFPWVLDPFLRTISTLAFILRGVDGTGAALIK